MSDDLVKRLTKPMVPYDPEVDAQDFWEDLCGEAKDHIEALTAQLAEDADVRTQIDHRIEELVAQVDALTAERDHQRQNKDQAYEERNRLAALLASMFPSGTKRTDIPGWDAEWHGAVYIDFPWGQASWHYHDSQAHLFAHLPPYEGEWDGHTTEAKYAAIQRAATSADLRAAEADNAQLRKKVQNQTDQINGLERSRRRLESLMAGADRRVELVEAENARLRGVVDKCESISKDAIAMCDEGHPVSAKNTAMAIIRAINPGRETE
jgi:hypothetical protein